jgi:hypothetical protein
LQNFTNAVLYGEELLAPGYDGINELTISNAAYLSDWTNDWVHLPINGDVYKEYLEKQKEKSRHLQNPANKEHPSGQYIERWNVRW